MHIDAQKVGRRHLEDYRLQHYCTALIQLRLSQVSIRIDLHCAIKKTVTDDCFLFMMLFIYHDSDAGRYICEALRAHTVGDYSVPPQIINSGNPIFG